jgi:D-aspartate ligase
LHNQIKTGALIIEGHVQGLSNTRSLGEAGIPVYVVDRNDCIARHSKYCKKFFKSPDFIEDAFAEFLIKLAEREKIKDWVLIPSNDHAVHTISKHKTQLEQYFKVITPGLDIINLIYDKLNLIKLAKENNIPVPVTHNFKSVAENLDSELQFPVLTKGRNGLTFYKTTGKKAFLAKNEAGLREQLRFIDRHYDVAKSFTQELIPFTGQNKTISFTSFCDKGVIKAHWTGVKLREHPIQFGTATFAKSTYIDDCFQQSKILLNAINYTGVCEVEYLQDPRDGLYKLIEINPRTWLWVSLAKASGVDYAKMIYNYMLNKNVNYSIANKKTRYWIHPFTDMVFSLLSISKGKLNPVIYLISLFKRNKVNALFIKGDIRPGFAYVTKLLSFIRLR